MDTSSKLSKPLAQEKSTTESKTSFPQLDSPAYAVNIYI